jgi:hypothetical protein
MTFFFWFWGVFFCVFRCFLLRFLNKYWSVFLLLLLLLCVCFLNIYIKFSSRFLEKKANPDTWIDVFLAQLSCVKNRNTHYWVLNFAPSDRKFYRGSNGANFIA